jgi:hypothetical protein
MGLIGKEDWAGAEWIAYEKIPDSLINILPTDGKKDTYKENNILPLLRRSFQVKKPIRNATMFICGLGQFELHINGKKIGDHFLDPGWTKYDKQALYVPFDVTKNIRNGENTIGVMLGNGFYYIPPVSGRYRKLKVAFGYPKMICRLAIEYNDGSVKNIVVIAYGRTTAGPITFSSIYGAKIMTHAWSNRDGTSLDFVQSERSCDGRWPSVLNAQMAEPLKVMESFRHKKFILF